VKTEVAGAMGRKRGTNRSIVLAGVHTCIPARLHNCTDGYVPLHSALAQPLREWQAQTSYAGETDFIFPSLKGHGRVPLSASVFVADHLRPAAILAGVQIEKSQRFGLHNLRHSLSNWLVNKAKIAPKTVQGILRHSRIQTTLDLYTQYDGDETRAAQGEFLQALGMRTEMLQ
jgi:integrase